MNRLLNSINYNHHYDTRNRLTLNLKDPKLFDSRFLTDFFKLVDLLQLFYAEYSYLWDFLLPFLTFNSKKCRYETPFILKFAQSYQYDFDYYPKIDFKK